MAGRDPRLSALSSSWIDGIPLDVARALLPLRYRLRPGFLAHIVLHARAQRRFQDAGSRPVASPRLPRAAQLNLLDSLRGTVERLSWNPDRTTWAGYYAHTNYTDDAMEQKKLFVAASGRQDRPRGSSPGPTREFSAVAACGARRRRRHRSRGGRDSPGANARQRANAWCARGRPRRALRVSDG
jgi:hypothetical protein